MFSEKRSEVMTEMWTKGMGHTARFVETWPKDGKKYAEMIVKKLFKQKKNKKIKYKTYYRTPGKQFYMTLW